MAVRESQDRQLGGHPEKLLTLEEAAQRLKRSADEVQGLIGQGRLEAFRLGGSLLRVRLQDVERLRLEGGAARGFGADRPVRPARVGRASPWERMRDFFYFNDFYLVALLILLILLAVILTL